MKVLVIIDMLNDFIHPDGLLYFEEGKKIIPAIKDKLEEARKDGTLVIYLKDTHLDDDSEFRLFPRHCIAGSWGAQIISDLSPIKPLKKFAIIPKRKFSGFFGTILDTYIAHSDKVGIVGVCTSICVMDTVQGFSYRDFGDITVYRDMTADITLAEHDYALKRMEKLYGAKIK